MSNFRWTGGMARLTFLLHGCNRVFETFAPAILRFYRGWMRNGALGDLPHRPRYELAIDRQTIRSYSYQVRKGLRTILSRLRRLIADTRAQDLVEYALLIAFLAFAAAATLPDVTKDLSKIYNKVDKVVRKAAQTKKAKKAKASPSSTQLY